MSEPKSQITWGCCDQVGDENAYVKCNICSKAFHLECLASTSMPSSSRTISQLTAEWKCPLCTKKPKGGNNDNTPLRSHRNSSSSRAPKRAAPEVSPKVDSEGILTRDDIQIIVQDVFGREMKNLLERLEQQLRSVIATEMAPIKLEIQTLQESIAFTSAQCEANAKNNTEMDGTLRKIREDNAALRAENQDLKYRLNQLEQYSRSNNVEIQCVPEKKTENLVKVITQLGNAIGYDVKNENILNCTRIAKLDPKNPRPRSIIVQFNSPRVRDTFIASAIKYNRSNPSNRLNSSLIDLAGEKKPIYVMEHLSVANKALHAAARVAAKEKSYRFVWVRNGRIYMRKTETSDHKLIKDHESLKNLD